MAKTKPCTCELCSLFVWA
uniref:Uncharacterized protein n=1 Tax=Anguilla anguilla TaxID=7936 RepID=A0A0E9P5Q3_ANGAN